MQNSLTQHIRNTITSHKAGYVFTHVDFFTFGNEATIERILSRLFEAGEIRRIRRGLYYKPEISRWGEVPPAHSAIVNALSRMMRTKFLPDGANALYQLGLTTQIPMKQVYLTEKQIGDIVIGKSKIEFRKVSEKKLSGRGKRAGLYLSAIEYLGKEEAFDESLQSKIAETLNEKEIHDLKSASKNRSAWVKEAVEHIITKAS
ncbi:MAG: DUF6088 family protein [Sulfuricurvum sp.]|uniref:DUF6088 family protein n=1 Tax=Sulfuricurvum sp. TaxID=2025608 RepID=UPI002627C259|nr:DUF6088 family protein [Sulfuricurvum sp.]MDD2830401.1 DUF6088 family protein [Sulfuricurvum sp.]MDD4950783.1 DUF6088 family protein [Sulfuricurvum sp.]